MRRSENGTRNTDRRASNRACRPRVEVMEDRRLLAVFVVGNANDGGPGSFRDAIDRANLFPDRDVIEFQIDSGPQTIELGSALAPINFPVLIAGSTQPGFDPTDPRPIVEIRGPGLDRRLDGLVIEADDTEVRSLVINNFGGNGILVGAESPAPPANVVIVNNFIGTDPDGDDTGSDVTGLGNGGNGVEIRAAIGLRIEGNVISGNFLSGVVDAGVETLLIGNIIGLGVSGSILVPNGQHGVVLNGPRATVGGVTPEARNVISGNNQDGIQIGFNSNSNVVEGNFIGVNRNGRNLRGNGTGIHIISTRGDNRIGGTTPGARNVISGNFGDGISIENSSPNNVISGNYIGLNFDGAGTSSNRRDGIRDSGTRTRIGGDEPGAGNVIVGNRGNGVRIEIAAEEASVVGNFIGVGADGTARVPGGGPDERLPGNGGDGVLDLSDTGSTIGGANVLVDGRVTLTRGNVIANNEGNGVQFGSRSVGSRLVGNFIGVDVTGGAGASRSGNGLHGVLLNSASRLTIGGTTAQERNVISGNALIGVVIQIGAGVDPEFPLGGNTVSGNYIGIDRDGVAAVGNGQGGVLINVDNPGALPNTIGGTVEGARNVISANGSDGVAITGLGSGRTLVQGNYIGTDRDGNVSSQGGRSLLGNSRNGIRIDDSPGNTILENLISGNEGDGVAVRFAGATGNVISGNFIGTDPAGDRAPGNTGDGVSIDSATANRVEFNHIAGNRNGVRIANLTAAATTGPNALVVGNTIGTDRAGASSRGNREDGVRVENSTAILVGGTTDASRNLISGNAGAGVQLIAASGIAIQGNFIGTNRAGTAAVPNTIGVAINGSTGSVVGGPTVRPGLGVGNLISGNSSVGVQVFGVGAGSNRIEGNLVGTDISGNSSLPNDVGVLLLNVSGNTVGGANVLNPDGSIGVFRGNILSGNRTSGVYLFDRGASNNQVLGNFIGPNLGGTATVAVQQDNPDLRNRQNLGVFLNDAPGNMIGSPASAVGGAPETRNLISGNVVGVNITGAGARSNRIEGNFIGTDRAGQSPMPNRVGVFINNAGSPLDPGTRRPDPNVAGNAILGNVISGNDVTGVHIFGPAAAGNVVQGNNLGTDSTGLRALRVVPPTRRGRRRPVVVQGVGVFIEDAPFNVIGGRGSRALVNVISGNADVGVYILGQGSVGNVVSGNFIGTDAGGRQVVANGSYGVLLFNASGSLATVDRSNAPDNRIVNTGIAGFREFTGPVRRRPSAGRSPVPGGPRALARPSGSGRTSSRRDAATEGRRGVS